MRKILAFLLCLLLPVLAYAGNSGYVYESSASPKWKGSVANTTVLPSTDSDCSVRATQDTHKIYVYNATSQTWAPPVADISLAGSIKGTVNQVTASANSNTVAADVTLSLPQSINTTSTPQFGKMGLGKVAEAGAVLAAAGQYYSVKVTDTVAAGAWTSDFNAGNVHYVVLGNGVNTVTLSNPVDGGRYILVLKQPASGAAGLVTWPNTVLWPGGAAPVLTTTNGKVDIVTFIYTSTNSKYYGSVSFNY